MQLRQEKEKREKRKHGVDLTHHRPRPSNLRTQLNQMDPLAEDYFGVALQGKTVLRSTLREIPLSGTTWAWCALKFLKLEAI